MEMLVERIRIDKKNKIIYLYNANEKEVEEAWEKFENGFTIVLVESE